MSLTNPYNYNLPVDDLMFYGRQQEVKAVVNHLTMIPGDSIALIGGRRMGKTSFLEKVLCSLKANSESHTSNILIIPLFLDFMGEGIISTSSFFGTIFNATTSALQLILSNHYKHSFSQFSVDLPPARAFHNSLREWERLVMSEINLRLRVVLLLDECEQITSQPWSENLYFALRYLLVGQETRSALKIVMAGSQTFLHQMRQDGSPLKNIFKYSKLEVLDESATHALINEPTNNVLSRELSQIIAKESGGHPFLVQYLMHHLCEYGLEEVSLQTVEQIASNFPYERTDFDDWLNELGTPAIEVCRNLVSVDHSETEITLRASVNCIPLELFQTLDALFYHGLVLRSKRQSYSITCGIFRRWFLKTYLNKSELPLGDNSQVGNKMGLKGFQIKKLTEALLDAFRTQAKLEQMVRFRLDKNLNAIAGGGNLTEIVFNLVELADSEGWIPELIIVARESNPGNRGLQLFASEYGIGLQMPDRVILERVIKHSNHFFDVNTWRDRLSELETQVCRIEIESSDGLICGTGFLINPQLVMTNYHVIEPLIQSNIGGSIPQNTKIKAQDVIIRFDYKKLNNGDTINPGLIYRLADDWLVDFSPYVTENRLPNANELDYVILRLDGEPGNEGIGKNPEPDAITRRWIRLTKNPPRLEIGSPLFILQHPQGEPLKLAIDTEGIISTNDNGTEVRYRTNTLPGSSGSPCFNSDWELVALHHSGDPNWNPTYNAGTPISAIVNLLCERQMNHIIH